MTLSPPFSAVRLLVPLLFALPALCQQSTVQGVVTDPSGAVLPDVRVSVVNTGTGVAQAAQTNEQGFYSVPFLIPGTYSIRAEKSGLAPVERTNLKLDVNQVARIDLALQLGEVKQTVEVSASAALLNTETSTVGQVIDNRRIVELPLNGRNYLELANLTVGAAPALGSRNGGQGAFTAVGQRAFQTNIYLDGIDNNSRASGGQLGFEAQAVTPSVDAVQEFKVVTNNNSAEYGFRMGGAVLVQTKSGTNELHGSLYEFFRNDRLDAVNFFAVGQPRPKYRRNQFGATAGGPVRKDQTFFFGSYEGTRLRLGESSTSTVPTAAFRNGDFSQSRPIFDPATTVRTGTTATRQPFAGNIIPATRFDPVALAVIRLYPEPNLPGTVNNYFFSGSQANDVDQFDGRLDHTFSPSHRVFFRYSRRDLNAVDPGPLPLPADGGLWQTTDLLSNSFVGNWSAILSPSVANEFRYGLTRTDSTLDIPWTENLNERLGIRGLSDLGDDNQRGVTRFTPTGYAELGARSFWPNRNNLDVTHIANHLSLIRGTHVLKTGGEFRHERLFRRAARFSRGQMAFNGAFTQDPANRGRTGDGMADFLLGLASGGSIGNQNGETAVARNYAVYFQDDWKVSRRLTLNLGLRWDRFGPPSFRDTPVSRFEFTPGSQAFRIVKPEDEGDCGCEHDNNNIAPRIGLAYQLDASTVVRSGFGVFYGAPDSVSHDGDSRFRNQAPEFTEIAFQTDQLVTPALVVREGFPAGLLPTTELRPLVGVNTIQPFLPSQYAMQWFLDVQRSLPGDMVLTLSYIGSGTRHLVWSRQVNQPLLPGAGDYQARRPYPFFGNISLRDPGGRASYQAFGAKAEKRFSRGLTFLTAYTWSHNIDDNAGTLDDGVSGGVRDAFNYAAERGNSAYDLRHNFVGSFVYDLPFGKGRRWLGQGGPADWLLGGWQVGGIAFLRSGRPFTPNLNGDLTNTRTTNRPNRVGSGVLPEDQRTLDRWFDVSAFTVPAQFVYGNSGRNILYGPGFTSMDLKIGKNFLFRERYRTEFRAEMFNFTNTPNFGLPNATTNLPQAGQIRTAAEPRRIQFGLKLLF